jgi:hypothetical protein
MQLPLTASALVPVGVGAVLAGALLILVVLAVRRRTWLQSPDVAWPQSVRKSTQVPSASVGDAGAVAPTPNGGSAPPGARTVPDTGASDDPTAGNPATAEPSPDAAAPVEPPPRPTPVRRSADHQAGSSRNVAAAVAEAFAVRAAAIRTGVPLPTRETGDAGPARQQPEPDEPRVAAPRSDDEPSAYRADGNGEQPAPSVPEDGAAPSPDGDRDLADPEQAAGDDVREPAAGAGANGNGRIAAPAVPTPRADGRGAVPSPRSEHDAAARDDATMPADSRDRLLAVLLDDPERVVGAAEELARCLHALERLTDAVRHERKVLREVLRKLADAGLRPRQLARLTGIPLAEMETLLTPVQQQAR